MLVKSYASAEAPSKCCEANIRFGTSTSIQIQDILKICYVVNNNNSTVIKLEMCIVNLLHQVSIEIYIVKGFIVEINLSNSKTIYFCILVYVIVSCFDVKDSLLKSIQAFQILPLCQN
jgi:hypothetical protein